MKVQILDLAKGDLVEGYSFYERREKGVGEYFLECLFVEIESLSIYGGIHRQVYRGLHRMLSKKFPFAIYYTVEEEVIFVRAVLDCRRQPSWIRHRLGKR